MNLMTLLALVLGLWLMLAVLMTVAWRIEQRTGNSGWVDFVWTSAMGLTGIVGATAMLSFSELSSRQVLIVALVLLSLVGLLAPNGTGLLAPAWAVALGAAIVVYNRWHKGNPVSPFFMGLCRMLVYLTAAATMTSEFSPTVLAGALVALAYLIGLTYVAKQEHLASFSGGWPLLFLAAPFIWLGADVLHTPSGVAIFAGFFVWVLYALSFLFRPGPGHVPKAVVSLIAGISLLDGLLVVSAGYPMLAWVCVGGFVLTLAGQRVVSGT